ncbi:hypothetical protein K501DRAFT_331649 [Backusella circina FSU 941]|nr:hypothetical protein K501DRAFT_331649 [Backusella circina FSU 941]
MEAEKRSLSLTDVARSLYPGSQFSLGAGETLSDKYDSALEVLLERQHQLTTKLRNSNDQINYLQKQCVQLKDTIKEAKKGNHSVLEQYHSLITNEDVNEDTNGTPQRNGNAMNQNGASLNVLNNKPTETDDKIQSRFKTIQPYQWLAFRHGAPKGQPKMDTKDGSRKIETRGRKKKVETRGRKKKAVVVPEDRLLLSTPTTSYSPEQGQPIALRYSNELYPNTPPQEQSSSSISSISSSSSSLRSRTDGPYSFRTVKKAATPSFYTNSEIVDELVEPVEFNKRIKKGGVVDDGYIGRYGGISNVHKRKRGGSTATEPTLGFGIKRGHVPEIEDNDNYITEIKPLVPHRTKFYGKPIEKRVRGVFTGNRYSARERRALKFLRESPNALSNPKYPLRIGPKAVLVDPGEVYPAPLFYSEFVIFPIGYEIIREFRSTVTPNAFSDYTCKITKEGDHPVFHVLPHDAPGVEIISLSPSGCWSEVLKRANNLIPTAHRANTASGIEYFHLGHPIPKLLIELLPDAEKCVGYKFIHPDKKHLNDA